MSELQEAGRTLLAQLRQHGYCLVQLSDSRAYDTLASLSGWMAGSDAGAKQRWAAAQAHAHSSGDNAVAGWLDLPAKEVYTLLADERMQAALPPGVAPGASQVLSSMHAQACGVLKCLSSALGAAPAGLLGLVDVAALPPGGVGAGVLHACYYKPAQAAAAAIAAARHGGEEGSMLGTEEHEDRGLLTLIVSDQGGGLEVLNRATGEWQGVPLGPGVAALLPGLSLEWATARRLLATLHRVVPGPGGRASLAYKLRVRPDAVVDPATLLGVAPGTLQARSRVTGEQLMQQLAASHPQSINSTLLQLGPAALWGKAQLRGAGAPAPAPAVAAIKAGRSRQGGGMLRFVVKSLSGRATPVEISAAATAADLKALYFDLEGMPPELQVLVFEGHMLANDDLLSQCGVRDGCAVGVICNLRGD